MAATPPGAPTIGTATAGNGQATISFTAPSSNGGAAITSYTATCTAGSTSKTASGAASPLTVTGLTNGTAYSCSVKATNSAGTGSASASVSVTPTATTVTVPGAPTIGTATAGNGQATISFTAPSTTGGAAITSYTATCTAGSTSKTATGTASPLTVTGLTNGTAYSCSVKATNSAGTGSASASVTVTPTATTVTVPGAPTIGTATAGDGQATITFTAPSSTGGAAITSYTATCTAGSTSKTATGTASPLTVTGLTNGTAYSCSVTATNSAGTGSASASVSVTPATSTSTITATATGNYGSITLAFTSVSGAGSYTGTCTAGSASVTASGTASPLLVTSLTNGTSYSCTVKAILNAATLAMSSAVTATPSTTRPVAPYVYGVLPGDSRISVMFNYIGAKVLSAVGSGTANSDYVATCTSTDGTSTATSTGSAEYSSGTASNPKANYTNPLIVSGLTNAKSYTCTVTATSGSSTALSNASAATTPNAGPPDSSGTLAATRNTTYETAYTSLASYCNYTNQSATGTGTAPTISYMPVGATSSSQITTGTSSATITCSTSSNTRTMTGNGLPDHRSSEFFTNGYTGYTGSPYLSGNPNLIGAASVSLSVPYSGTISTAYSAGTNGYYTSACYNWTSAATASQNFKAYTSSTGSYLCTMVKFPGFPGNSVKLEPSTAETYTGTSGTIYNVVGKNLYQDVGLDPSNGHNQPTVSGSTTYMWGTYHYHGIPEGHVARIGKGNSTMTLVGFAVDGFPIYARYGYTNRTSTSGGVKVMKSNYRLRTTAELTAAGYTDRPSTTIAPLGTFEQDWVFDANAGGDLDACNGRYGVTPESPTTAVYHYYMTDSYPFIQRCVFGVLPTNTWANGG